VDIEAHNYLVESLSALIPGVPVLSEEDAAARAGDRPDVYWLIDPLDGTASYVDGFDGFVTQAALIRDRKPVLACVRAPAIEQTYLAEQGGGATLNGVRLSVRVRAREHWTLTDNYPTPRGVAAALMQDWKLAGYLECGSIGLKICRVASGDADLFIKDVAVRDWDVAAPQLVLLESGGFLSNAAGNVFGYAGSYEHRGLVACTSAEGGAQAVDWLRRREP
jgi:3'(2'), 5'-bisphosphate nucleotidase/myo-inositol-1(or 4)-monophosphatase